MPSEKHELKPSPKQTHGAKASKPTVKLIHSDYQPSKAELQEEITLPGIEGKSLEQISQRVLQPVNIKWVDNPKK